MTKWLDHAYMPARKLDLSAITQSLTALELAFAAIGTARADVLEQYGTDGNGVARTQLRNLEAKARAALAEAKRQIGEQFTQLRADADAMRNEARREFATSPEGAHYRQSLAGFAALAQLMDAGQLADRLNDAVAAGLVSEAKAWGELARLKYPAAEGVDDSGLSAKHPTTRLRLALWDADEKARTPGERQADDAISTVEVAARRFGLFSTTIDDRLTGVLEGRSTDPFAGNFQPTNIIPGATAEGGE